MSLTKEMKRIAAMTLEEFIATYPTKKNDTEPYCSYKRYGFIFTDGNEPFTTELKREHFKRATIGSACDCAIAQSIKSDGQVLNVAVGDHDTFIVFQNGCGVKYPNNAEVDALTRAFDDERIYVPVNTQVTFYPEAPSQRIGAKSRRSGRKTSGKSKGLRSNALSRLHEERQVPRRRVAELRASKPKRKAS